MRKGPADNVAQEINVEATLLRGRGRCGQMLRILLTDRGAVRRGGSGGQARRNCGPCLELLRASLLKKEAFLRSVHSHLNLQLSTAPKI